MQRRIPAEIALQIAEHIGADELSAGEIEVLRHVAANCSNRVVANKLRLSKDPIKAHMRSILEKLQANDRTHAVTIAVRRGLLER